MKSSRCCSIVHLTSLALACIAVLALSLAAGAQSQQSVFGQWQTTTVITTGGYSERYAVELALYPNWAFMQKTQSLAFAERRGQTIGTFSPLPTLGQNAYRFVVTRRQPHEMPAWNARMTLLSPIIMLYEDLTLGGKLRYQRVQ